MRALFDDLDDVFVFEHVLASDLLRIVLDGRTPHHGAATRRRGAQTREKSKRGKVRNEVSAWRDTSGAESE